VSTFEYRQKNKEKIAAYNKAWNIAHPTYSTEYSRSNKDHLNSLRRKNREENPEKYRKRDRNYRASTPEMSKIRDRRQRLNRRIPIVYICRNVDNEVIYVGRGTTKRLSWHKAYSSWWNEMTNLKIRKRASWGDSLVLEALLIRKYQPKYNKEGVSQ
jgi:hypothetical protein